MNKPPVEIELKLKLDPEHRSVLAEHPLIRGHLISPPETQQLVTTYFDTSDRALIRQGINLRVRQKGKERTQTLKGRGDGQLAATRDEWEWPLTSDVPDLSLLNETPYRHLAQTGFLLPLFASHVTREVYRIGFRNSRIEIALDEGWVVAGERRNDFAEVELECLEGSPIDLYELALLLHETIPFRLARATKASRGFRLLDERGFVLANQVTSELDPAPTTGQMLQKILGTLLGRLVASQEAIGGETAHHALEQIHASVLKIANLLDCAADLFAPPPDTHLLEQVAYFSDIPRDRLQIEIEKPSFTSLLLKLSIYGDRVEKCSGIAAIKLSDP